MENAMLFGVCSGLGKQFNLNPNGLRLLLVILTLLGAGLPLVIYIILAIIMPQEVKNEKDI